MKKILSLLCLLMVFFAGFAETKTYQLCTDIDEITNPDNQFELHPKSWTQNFWGALCIDTTTLKND